MADPTINELDLYLRELEKWERFAINLPGINQQDISRIKDRRSLISDQKLDLFSRWMQVYPSPSWEDVILALEKADERKIAGSLRDEFIQALVPEVHVSGEVIDELEELHSDFVSLTTEVKRNIKTEIDEGRESLSGLIQHVEEQKTVISSDDVDTTDQFFQAVRPHYNFLDYFLIVSLAVLLSGHIASIAREYRSRTQRFTRESEVVTLRSQLEPFFHSSKSSADVMVLIILEKAWGQHVKGLVEQLVQHFFFLTHPDQCQWFRVSSGGKKRNIIRKGINFQER